MNVFFIKATYTNNVYKLSDFYTGTNYVQNANKKLDVLFKADDGITSLVTPISLPDSTDVRDYTHVIVPDQKKIYKIIATDYHNVNQYFITLDDDPLIANYQELKDKNIILNRTNSQGYFEGINDNANLITKKQLNILKTTNDKPKSKIGGWALLFFQSDVTDLKIKFDNSPTLFEKETFTTFASLIAKYPEVSTVHPSAYDYFLKEVIVSGDSRMYQCVWSEEATPKLRWVKVYTYQEIEFAVPNPEKYFLYKANYSDIQTFVLALPLRHEIYVDGSLLPAFQDLTVINKPDSLIDIKFISDDFIKTKTFTTAYDSSNKLCPASISFDLTNVYKKTLTVVDTPSTKDFSIINPINFNEVIDVSRTALTSNFEEYPPFKTHYLQVFGERFQISPRYHDKLKLYLNISTGVINYIIYYDKKENIIASGSFTHQAKWTADQLDRFYQQNPTYKDQFYLKMGVDSIKTIAGGVIGGAVVGGPIGAVTGLAGGVIGAGIDAGLSQINLKMQEKSLRLQPDNINGNNSDLSLQLANVFGIFWISEEPVSVLGGLTQMQTEIAINGYPTSRVVAIDSLVAQSNAIFGTCKIVFGELKLVVKNQYVTGYINQKLKEGVIFI